jgi:hypothetical protein
MARNNVGIMPLHAASLGGHAAMGKLLLDQGAQIDAKDTYWTALHNASRGGHAEFVRPRPPPGPLLPAIFERACVWLNCGSGSGRAPQPAQRRCEFTAQRRSEHTALY